MTSVRHILILLTAALIIGCTHTRYSRHQVIDMAKQTAESRGYKLTDYQEPKASYGLGGEKNWYVYFQGRELFPGNYFAVEVDERSGHVELIRGK
jgi:hypothetical protein